MGQNQIEGDLISISEKNKNKNKFCDKLNFEILAQVPLLIRYTLEWYRLISVRALSELV